MIRRSLFTFDIVERMSNGMTFYASLKTIHLAFRYLQVTMPNTLILEWIAHEAIKIPKKEMAPADFLFLAANTNDRVKEMRKFT